MRKKDQGVVVCDWIHRKGAQGNVDKSSHVNLVIEAKPNPTRCFPSVVRGPRDADLFALRNVLKAVHIIKSVGTVSM